jgi:NAD(P)-dependent dehydrogenase (short-subunit alcohol dehydrogenase family)
MAEKPLEGKVALVTGAGSNPGIGRVIAHALVRSGAKVAMTDINPASLELSANEAREIGKDDAVLPIIGDVSEPADAERIVQEAIDGFGGLHVLVNNAGISPTSIDPSLDRNPNVWDIDPATWARIITVNMGGAFLMSRAAIPYLLRQKWGRVIGVTTSLDTMIRGHNAPYGPSKAGHEALVSALAQELEGTGVTANVLIPGGGTDTNFIPQTPGFDRSVLIHPGVMGDPAVWLASDASDATNGMRFTAVDWDERLPIDERIAKCAAPVAWSQLGRAVGQRIKGLV